MHIVPSDSNGIRIVRQGIGYPGFRMKDYGVISPHISTTEIIISVRYPEKGFVVNTGCDMSAFVSCGSGWVITPDSNQRFSIGDVIVIRKGKKFCFESDHANGRSYETNCGFGKMITLIASFSPAWTAEQHQTVE
jgi:hypothetical protein